MSSFKSYGPGVLAGILILLSLVLLPLYLFLLAAIVIIIGFVLVDAMSNRLLLTIAMRNIARKKSTTALAICGLMVGTAIISASFAVGDTMNNMVVQEVSKGYGEVDFGLHDMEARGYHYYNSTELGPVMTDLRAIPHVEYVEPTIEETVGARCNDSGLISSNVGFYGISYNYMTEFGGLYSKDGPRLDTLPANGTAYMHEGLARDLDLGSGGHIVLGFGGRTATLTVTTIVKDKGLATFGSNGIYVSYQWAQNFTGNLDGANSVQVTIVGPRDAGMGHAGQVRTDIKNALAKHPGLGLQITEDKYSFLKTVQNEMSTFTDLFFVFGTFSIISGIVLIVNIFTMLGEERKGEFGVLRAIGMKKVAVRRVFTYEGVVYGAVAAAVGAFLGLGLAYLIIDFLGSIGITGGGALTDYFTISTTSFLEAYMAGLLLTIFTVFLAVYRISNLNIVRATRKIPEPEVKRDDKGVLRMGAAGVGAGILLILLGLGARSVSFDMTGLSVALLSTGLLLRRPLGDRAGWSIAGLLTFIIWLPWVHVFAFTNGTSGIEMFVISGVFMVTSVLLLVIFNSDPIIRGLVRLLSTKGKYRAVVRTSMSYPLKSKFRTALSVFIFGLVIFTIVTLSIMTGLMTQTVTKVVNDASGGYDAVGATSSGVTVKDLWGTINASSGYLRPQNVTSVASLYAGFVKINHTQKNGYMDQFATAYGFDNMFYTTGRFPLSGWESKYPTQTAVWEAVNFNTSLVIVDGSMMPQTGGYSSYAALSTSAARVRPGETMVLQTSLGAFVNVTVAGVLEETIFQGVFMSKAAVQDHLGINASAVFMIKFKPGLDAEAQCVLLRKDFVDFGLQTVVLRTIADKAAQQINGVFQLLEAFLALGLIIGLSGLGIITIRSIHERTLEIGVMRAIGYRRSMVIANFALESTLVSTLGIIIGVFLGILTGYRLWIGSFPDVNFGIPWLEIAFVAFGSLAITLASIFPAARGASRVAPAEVLRNE